MLSCMALATAAFTGCSSSNDGPDNPTPTPTTGTKLTVATEVITKATHVNELVTGQQMNVYVKKSRSLKAEDLVPNVMGERGGDGIWKLTPEVYLPKEATVAYFYAAYPYNSAATDPEKYPVDMNAQADVLYSGDAYTCSHQTTTARLRMKHALAMLCFNVDASSYSGTGNVTAIAVEGEKIMTKGTMDVVKGTVTPVAFGKVTGKADCNVKNKGANPNIWVTAFQTTASPATLTLTIDGKEYSATFPDVTVANEYQYGFHLMLTDNGLVFRPGDAEKISLNEGIDEMETPLMYGLVGITTTASELTFPIFTGDGVFGTAKSGSDMANYSAGGSIKLNGSGSKKVSIETWNSTGFKIPSVVGIEEIDISNY